MSAILHAQALADGAASTATTHAATGGGASLAAIIGIAWMYHHAHRTTAEAKKANPNTKHDTRRTVVAAFLLGILLCAGGGAIGTAVDSGTSSVASML
jgi:amino acid transporter